MDYKKEAASVLDQISKELDRFTAEDTNTGLLGGYTGCALFYAYYYQLTSRDEYLDKVHAIIQRALEAMSEEPMNGSHCSGIAGVAWTLQHLIAIGFIEAEDMGDTFSEIDTIVGEFMETELQQGRNDFLHQGLGSALYFLQRLPDPVAVKQLENLITVLQASAHTLPAGIAWKDQFSSSSEEHKDKDLFNLGLAHGNPAIIAILARLYEKGIATATVASLINSSVQFLLASKNQAGGNGRSVYPVITDADNTAVGDTHSRLGWCYGDLGIATVLWGTGQRLGRDDYKQEALHIFRDIAQHRNHTNGAINDACMCHGSAGIAHILQQAALASGDPLLHNAALEWMQATLRLNTWPDGAAGYKFYHHPEYTNSYNVLEGIAGIGLSLISFLDTDNKPAWNEILLVS